MAISQKGSSALAKASVVMDMLPRSAIRSEIKVIEKRTAYMD